MKIIGAFFALAMLSGSLALETTSAASTNEGEYEGAIWIRISSCASAAVSFALVVVASVPQPGTSDSSTSRTDSQADVLQIYSQACSAPSNDSCTNAKTGSAAHSACAAPHGSPEPSRSYDDSATNSKAGSSPSTSNELSGHDDDSVAYSTACSATAHDCSTYHEDDGSTYHEDDGSTYDEDDANAVAYPSSNDDATVETADSAHQRSCAFADTRSHTIPRQSSHSIANETSITTPDAQPGERTAQPAIARDDDAHDDAVAPHAACSSDPSHHSDATDQANHPHAPDDTNKPKHPEHPDI